MLVPVKLACSSYLLLYLVHLVEDGFVQVGKLYSIIRDDDGTPQKCSMDSLTLIRKLFSHFRRVTQ